MMFNLSLLAIILDGQLGYFFNQTKPVQFICYVKPLSPVSSQCVYILLAVKPKG